MAQPGPGEVSGRTPIGAIDPTAVARFGTMVFLASDVMVFAAFFAATFLLRADNRPWPPDGVDLAIARPALATAALVASSLTLRAGERSGRDHPAGIEPARLRRWLLATMALGLGFLVNQLVEYTTLPFGFGTHVYGSTYWGLTGLHTVHVAAGLVALGLLWVRLGRAATASDVDPWRAGVSLFWHLVDVVWLFVFTTIWIVR